MTTDDEIQPWERQPHETPKAWEAFLEYREMGTSRTMGKVAKTLGKHDSQIHLWAHKYGWSDRVAALDRFEDAQWRRFKFAERVAEGRRQLAIARRMTNTGVTLLLNVDAAIAANTPIPQATMLKLLELGMKTSRDILGVDEVEEPTAVTVHLVDAAMFPPGARILTDDEADVG